MESARTFLFVLFAFLTFLLYNAWQEENKPIVIDKPPIETSLEYVLPNEGKSDEVAMVERKDDLSAELPVTQGEKATIALDEGRLQPIEVSTDALKVLISPISGNFISAELLNYKETLADDSLPINILENRNGRTYLALSGLYGVGAPDFQGTKAVFTSDFSKYELAEGSDKIEIDLRWNNTKGVEYVKRFTFYRNLFLVDVKYLVENKSSEKIANRMFTAIKRDQLAPEGEISEGMGMQSYLGPAYSTLNSKYNKYDFEDISEKDLEEKTNNGWIALLQHYFVTAWVPQSSGENKIDTTTKNLGKAGLVQIRITQDWEWIEPGQLKEFSAKFYVGPKIQADLETISDGLELTVDYGFLWWIGQPIFYMLLFFQGLVVNWAAAIILVTVAIKTILYPLARAQYRSFAKMRLLQPKMTEMKERYGDDRQQMSMKMMELYKTEKVNPLGGCFPLLIQMPVFIALYWVLQESVQLRHAPFMLWIDDLSVKDPFFVLPLLMGASMYLMQKMQPTSPTMDPMQQKIMQMMPVFMTVFFVFFPAGLVLYWLMNNLISIAQQLYITNQFNKEQEIKK